MFKFAVLLAAVPVDGGPADEPPADATVLRATPRRAVPPVPGAAFETAWDDLVIEKLKVEEVTPVVILFVGRAEVVNTRWVCRVAFTETVTTAVPLLPLPVKTVAKRVEVVGFDVGPALRLR